MREKIKQTWSNLGDEIFPSFAKGFSFELAVIPTIIFQCVVIEFGIFLSYEKEKISFVVYAIRLSLALSIFCLAHANKACHSYVNRNQSSVHRKRAIKNFWYGFILFIVPVIYLLFIYFNR
jgi:hypothetical protein